METIKFRMPKDKYNQLNNFYLEHFGCDVYTQLMNFFLDEMKRCEDSSDEKPVEHPHPYIFLSHERKSKYRLVVTYPDGSTSQVYADDYMLLLDIWNEWSKYQFALDYKEIVLLKHASEKVLYVQKFYDKYTVIKSFDGHRRKFGKYDSFEDAYMVKCFLEEHDWDMKYNFSNVKAKIADCNQNNYSEYMLKIARGELVL